MLKLFKEEIIDINGEEIPIRAYRNADADIVANLLEQQYILEDLQKKLRENVDSKEFVQAKKSMEDAAHILAQRGLKRVLVDDFNFKSDIDDLDNYDDFEVDPDYELLIAWTMISLGTPGTQRGSAGKKQTRKKSSKQKSSSKT